MEVCGISAITSDFCTKPYIAEDRFRVVIRTFIQISVKYLDVYKWQSFPVISYLSNIVS